MDMLPPPARRALVALATLLLAAACQPGPPDASAPARQPAAKSVAPAVAAPPPTVKPAPPAAIALPSMELPPGPIYVCDVAGVRTPIEYVENVESLCRRHPEMSVCQYERRACRSRGGRVYTANGEEVTTAIEAEYDRKVQRVTFQSDGAPAKKK